MTTERGFIIPSPSMIMAGAIVALFLSNVLFYNLWQGAKDDVKTVESTLLAERAQYKLDADQAKLDAERITHNLEAAHAAAIARLGNNRVVRVLPCPDSGVQNGNAGASGGLNPPISTTGLDTVTITPAQCQKRLNDGLEDSVDYEWLAYWVTLQRRKYKDE